MKFRMGVGSSPEAAARAKIVIQTLQFTYDGLEVETVPIQTTGERLSAGASGDLSPVPDDASVREIEDALVAGGIDFAVHRAKDLPVKVREGLCVAAYPKREDPRDVFVSVNGSGWAGFTAGKVGVSSLRRRFQVARARPGVEFVPLRGDMAGRLGRMSAGVCDALLVSAVDWASLARPGAKAEFLPVEDMVPAPGQGALAVEARLDRADIRQAMVYVDDALCRMEIDFERSLLRVLGPGCAPVLGALARSAEEGVTLTVFHAQPDGSKPLRMRRCCRNPADRDGFIADFAEGIRRG